MSFVKLTLLSFFIWLIVRGREKQKEENNSPLPSGMGNKSMKSDEKIPKNDIIMKRPGTGLNGQKINMIIGKKLRKNFSKDHQIRKQDLI